MCLHFYRLPGDARAVGPRTTPERDKDRDARTTVRGLGLGVGREHKDLVVLNPGCLDLILEDIGAPWAVGQQDESVRNDCSLQKRTTQWEQTRDGRPLSVQVGSQ